MAIYGIGAYQARDVHQEFLDNGLIFVGWGPADAPELVQYIRALRVGDIVYIKSHSPRSPSLVIKGIGIVADADVITHNGNMGRRVSWLDRQEFRIPKPTEKNNVRNNTIYEEFHPAVQSEILNKIRQQNKTPEHISEGRERPSENAQR